LIINDDDVCDKFQIVPAPLLELLETIVMHLEGASVNQTLLELHVTSVPWASADSLNVEVSQSLNII